MTENYAYNCSSMKMYQEFEKRIKEVMNDEVAIMLPFLFLWTLFLDFDDEEKWQQKREPFSK